jgi:hypothetical protein
MATVQAEQTIVFFRHGEKPPGGLGQLTCQGPNPATKMSDPAGSYFYVRPLATIEPVAIRAGRSVNTNYGYNNITGLRNILVRSSKADTTIFVAWEHAYLVRVVRSIMDAYGGGQAVPDWTTGDYDSLYIVRINYANGSIDASFSRDREGLNGLSTTCPSESPEQRGPAWRHETNLRPSGRAPRHSIPPWLTLRAGTFFRRSRAREPPRGAPCDLSGHLQLPESLMMGRAAELEVSRRRISIAARPRIRPLGRCHARSSRQEHAREEGPGSRSSPHHHRRIDEAERYRFLAGRARDAVHLRAAQSRQAG